MLILSRKVGEQIEIGGGIVVTVLSVRRGNARLGIEAPPYVEIRRGKPPGGEELVTCARQGDLATLNKVEGQDAATDRRRELLTGRW